MNDDVHGTLPAYRDALINDLNVPVVDAQALLREVASEASGRSAAAYADMKDAWKTFANAWACCARTRASERASSQRPPTLMCMSTHGSASARWPCCLPPSVPFRHWRAADATNLLTEADGLLV
nr:hypothetical protein [Cupriavidus sp. EM10]